MIRVGNANLEVMGLQSMVSPYQPCFNVHNVLRLLGYPQREAELARIADICTCWNVVGKGDTFVRRYLGYYILDQTRMPDEVLL